ncbi:MAG: DinB family protein [Actinomycetota bacterium]|nr:DinB family protein [Actinomycetota bacterium]
MDDQNFLASERDGLVSFLDAQREGLIRKVDGVDDAQARMAPTASTLSLLGLVKHAATWERRWFGVVMAGRVAPDKWPEVKPPTTRCRPVHRRHRHRESLDRARSFAAMDLDSPCARTDIVECNVRYVLFHMIEETARHAGHADIIRETLDGTGGY